jgi:hypothetical protein
MRIQLSEKFIDRVADALRNVAETPKTASDWSAFLDELAEIGLATYARRRRKLKRGDLSECGKFRFYAYQSYVRKDGCRTETWIPVDEFEDYCRKAQERQALNEAKAEYRKQQKQKLAQKPNDYLLKTYGIR